MNVLFDTNVVLDVLFDRFPFSEPATQLFGHVERHHITGYLCGTTVTTISYLAQKTVGVTKARAEIQKLLQLFQIAPVTKAVLDAAIQADFSDFEDAVIYASARQCAVEAIVTRNPSDFKKADITIYSPLELANLVQQRASLIT